MKRLLVILLPFLAFSCDDSNESTVYRIDERLAPYLEAFITEAMNHGVQVQQENLILQFGTSTEEICGQCTRPKNGGQRTIIIVEDSYCWKDAMTQTREAVVFHELGHCLLGRNHRDSLLPNGDPASLMHTQNHGPYSPCAYDLHGDGTCDKRPRRSYYVDELFDPSTQVPEWGK